MEVTGIILAGGASSRMGTDKGLLPLCGKPLISYVISALSGLCSHMMISSSSEMYHSFGCEVVADEYPGIGPMGGIYSALRKSKTHHNLVVSCDLPFVSEALLSYILLKAAGHQVAVPWLGGQHYEPLCGYYHADMVEIIFKYIQKGNYKMPDLFNQININRLEINNKLSFYDANLFLNVNSKNDLLVAEMLMNRGIE